MALKSDILAFGENVLGKVTKFVRENPLLTGAGLGVAAPIIATGAIKLVSSSSKKKTKKTKRKKTKSKISKKCKKTRKRTTKRSPQKRIRHTKKGQPYIILSSGKARFIKKSSAKSRKKRKGGYY